MTFYHCDKTSEEINFKRGKDLFWLVSLEGSVHCCLVPSGLWACAKQRIVVGSMWWIRSPITWRPRRGEGGRGRDRERSGECFGAPPALTRLPPVRIQVVISSQQNRRLLTRPSTVTSKSKVQGYCREAEPWPES